MSSLIDLHRDLTKVRAAYMLGMLQFQVDPDATECRYSCGCAMAELKAATQKLEALMQR